MTTAKTQQCTHCSKTFSITARDEEFYRSMDVPPPKHCPACRLQRRLAYRNERNLYRRTCVATGKQILSAFNPTRPYPVYDIAAWWQDSWNALDYGQAIDFSRPFFEQFTELQTKVPRLALQQQQPMENSEYCNCASRNKNCYLVFSTNYCEDCYYGSWVNQSKSSIDNYNILKCELCYECIDCRDCYHCLYAQDSRHCTDSYFIKNCQGCRNVAFCTNQVNAEYALFNKTVPRTEFEQFVQSLRTASRADWDKYLKQYHDLMKKSFIRYFQGTRNETSTGNYINNCKDCLDCFIVDASEQVRYSAHLEFAKDCMDYTYWGQQAERMYETQACGYNVTNLKFCNLCWSGCENLEYCDQCFSTKNCFGCVGLKKQQFCILNTQYTEPEYHRLVEKLKQHMRATGEYGEFFPIQHSHFDYNETLAHEFFPLTREHVLQNNWRWKEKDVTEYQPQTYTLPEQTTVVTDEILSAVLACTTCRRNYKIIPQELALYRQENLPIPQLCPTCRHLARLAQRPGYATWTRQCMCTQPQHIHGSSRCNQEFVTAYSPDQPQLVYCEDCHKKEVY